MSRDKDRGNRRGPPRGGERGERSGRRHGDDAGRGDERKPGDRRRGSAQNADHGQRDTGVIGQRRPDSRPQDDLIRVAGLPSVVELFETSPERVERLYFEADLKAKLQGYCDVLARRHRVFRQVKDEEMRRVAGTAMHGGVVALARPRPIRTFDPSSVAGWAGKGHPLLVLDGIENPQNIGAIARSAAFFGIPRLLISGHSGQTGLSDAAYRIAKGGLEWIEVLVVEDLPRALRQLSQHYEVVGTVIGKSKRQAEPRPSDRPVALVLCEDEQGLTGATLSACTRVLALEGRGRVQSLNVGATAAILIHSVWGRDL